jgi:hypothetical protein
VRQRRKRRLAVRRGPTETGLEALELAENLIELFGDVGVRTDVLNINGNGSHRRRREWGWDMRRKRRLELGVRLPWCLELWMGLPWLMRPLRPLRRLRPGLGRALHRLHLLGDELSESLNRAEGEAGGSTGALLHLAVRADLDIKGVHRHLRRQDDRPALPGSEWPSPASRGPGLHALVRLRGMMRRSSPPFIPPSSPPFRMLEEGDEIGDHVVGRTIVPLHRHGLPFRLR